MQPLIDDFWNFWDIYLYTSILQCNQRHNMVWSKRTIPLVICRYRSNGFKVTEFSQASYLGCNVELLNKAANSSPESGETQRTGSPKTLERPYCMSKYSTCSLCNASVPLPSHIQINSLGTNKQITCFKYYGLESTFQPA